jgi:hypothetical protein
MSDPSLLSDSLTPWSQQAAAAAAAGSGISTQGDRLQQYMMLQQRLALEQRLLAEQQRMIEHRALERLLLEQQRIRALQGEAGSADGMYPSDPVLASALAGMSSSNLPVGGLGMTGSAVGAGSLNLYASATNPLLGSLGGLAGVSSARNPVSTMNDEILNAMALGSIHQDQAFGGRQQPWINSLSSLPGGTDAGGGLAAGSGGRPFGLQSAAATQVSRRLVRSIMHPSPTGTRDGTDASEDSRGNIGSGGEF